MAGTGAVFDVVPAGEPRAPEQILGRAPGQARPPGPEAVNRWYTAGITASRAETIAAVFGQAGRRDPGHAQPWIALVDGDVHQIEVICAQAAERDVSVTILVDFIHVLEYLWKAAWCFHPARDPAAGDWGTAQGLDILHGRVPGVISRIGELAAAHPPRARQRARQDHPHHPGLPGRQAALDGLPSRPRRRLAIATGVIEGACRHLVQGRTGITGARWGLPGAQAMLWLRAIAASGDTNAYWDWHITQEHQRNHLSRYHDTHDLAA
jgi:hypothetical protein